MALHELLGTAQWILETLYETHYLFMGTHTARTPEALLGTVYTCIFNR